jgi:hypothetical protein
VQRQFTNADRALQRCSNASNELELHCLSAANPFLVCLNCIETRPENRQKFFSGFQAAMTRKPLRGLVGLA